MQCLSGETIQDSMVRLFLNIQADKSQPNDSAAMLDIPEFLKAKLTNRMPWI
jgi:hypothetical protein